MKTRFLLSLLFCAGCSYAAAQSSLPSPTSFGTARPLNDTWLFQLADDSAAISPAFDDSRWQRIQLPHDWSVRLPMSPDGGSCQGYLPGGIAWYRRHITPAELATAQAPSSAPHPAELSPDISRPAELSPDIPCPVAGGSSASKTFLYFEGIYNRATVYLNGHRLGYRPSGFASVLYDLTPYLRTDSDNVVAVRVDHSRQNDSRWYTGSGINRPVWLVSAPTTHFALWGTSWKVKSLSAQKAVVDISLSITSDSAAPDGSPSASKLSTLIEILDADGKVVATKRSPLVNCQLSTVNCQLKNPRRWTLSSPYLYKVRARLMQDGREIDRSEVPLGLRTLTFSPDHGFALNGEWMKVKGVCLHDDAGVLGTAVPTDVWRQRLLTLKSLGANAIRMSHNPHAPALYDLCDSLGLLVMDEASDEWEFPKRKWLKGWNQGTPGYEGTYDYFEEWIDHDVADMVRRDRCHPSIFLWSIGNEVDYPNDPYSHPVLNGDKSMTQPIYGGYKPEQPNAERIGIIAQRLAKVVRDIDDSRAVTGALAGIVMSNATAYPSAVDVVGYNYTESRYAEDHQRYPDRVIYGSENRHDLPSWVAVRDNEHIFGQFLWTGIDYLGESGPWPARGSGAGLLDLAGFVKPLGHYRAALWSETPICYIGTYPAARPNSRRYRGRENREWVSPYAAALWNYDDGQRVRVVCYTNAPSARLLLCPAGSDAADPASYIPVGDEPIRDAATDILYWDIDYQPGTLRCEADNGATASIVTCGRPYALRATADKSTLAHRDEVTRIVIEVTDENGNLVPVADNDITCRTTGAVRLLGLENGDLSDTTDKTRGHCRAHAGCLVAYIAPRTQETQDSQDNRQQHTATIRFSTPLLTSAELTLNIP